MAAERGWRTGAAFAAACICFLVWPAPPQTARHIVASSRLELVDIGQVSADVTVLKNGQTAPDFVLKDAAGADIRL
jgi:hypothetical protein